ncbi:MAG: hypothetical protein LAO04_05150 [Acidobacteriia bacterium]|nr:hypothetical protein [Terriglobia bacterium]
MGGWQEVILFVVFGFIVSWVGSYCINLVRVPGMVHREQNRSIQAKNAEIERRTKELQGLKAKVSTIPFSFQAEIDRINPPISVWASDTLIGGGPDRQPIEVPRVVLTVWKKPQSQDLEVTITNCRLGNLRIPASQPDFSVRRIIKGEDAVDVTEELVRFVAGDPINRQRLLRFSQDVKVVLGYEVLSTPSEASTCFRMNGKLNAGRLQLEIEQLPNPSSSITG